MPRGWISRLKNTTFKCTNDLPVAVFYAIISKRKYFFSNLQTCKYTLFLEDCKFEKKYFRLERGWISRLKNYHDLHICTRPTCRGIISDGIRKKIYFPTGSIFFSIYKLLKKMVYLEGCKFQKNTSGFNLFANTIA